MPNIEEKIIEVAREFTSELRKLHEGMAWKPYKTSDLRLNINFSLETAEFTIEWSDYPISVKGASLGAVMDEVYRRLNYEDREKGRIATTLIALTPPRPEQEDDDPIQF